MILAKLKAQIQNAINSMKISSMKAVQNNIQIQIQNNIQNQIQNSSMKAVQNNIQIQNDKDDKDLSYFDGSN